jgi:FtsP/CotA-like multicopper oxidase with cupredoxin domain
MKTTLLLPLVVAAVVFGAVYALVKPTPATAPSPLATTERPPDSFAAVQRQPAAPISPPTMPYAQPSVFDIVVQNGKRSSEPAVLRAHQGDEVTLRITSDTADELHLHGYNLHLRVSPETTAVLQFTANRTGRFTYELHKSGVELGALEVYPR